MENKIRGIRWNPDLDLIHVDFVAGALIDLITYRVGPSLSIHNLTLADVETLKQVLGEALKAFKSKATKEE